MHLHIAHTPTPHSLTSRGQSVLSKWVLNFRPQHSPAAISQGLAVSKRQPSTSLGQGVDYYSWKLLAVRYIGSLIKPS